MRWLVGRLRRYGLRDTPYWLPLWMAWWLAFLVWGTVLTSWAFFDEGGDRLIVAAGNTGFYRYIVLAGAAIETCKMLGVGDGPWHRRWSAMSALYWTFTTILLFLADLSPGFGFAFGVAVIAFADWRWQRAWVGHAD